MLDDFLVYTEDYFPDLGPFRTLGLAHGNWFRQSRRLRQLLGEAIGVNAVIDVYGPYIETPAGDAIGAKTYLRMTDDGSEVELALCPADTLSQARAFYTRSAGVSGLAKLRGQPGWHVQAELPLRAHAARLLLDDHLSRRRRVRRAVDARDPSSRRGGPGSMGRVLGVAGKGADRRAAGSSRSSTGTSPTRSARPLRRDRVCGSRAGGRSPKRRRSTPVARCTHKCARRSTPLWWRSASWRSNGARRSDRPFPKRAGIPQLTTCSPLSVGSPRGSLERKSTVAHPTSR